MRELFLVAYQEFIVRVRSKAFILSTLLLPLLLILILLFPLFIEKMVKETGNYVVVIRNTSPLSPYLSSNLRFTFVKAPPKVWEQLKKAPGKDTLVIQFPKDLTKQQLNFTVYTAEKLPVATAEALKNQIEIALQNYRLEQQGISKAVVEALQFKLQLQTIEIVEEGAQQTSVIAGMAMAYIMAFLMYMLLLIYGSVIMNSVIEEKANRTVEVMLCSIRPATLLFGKVVGVGILALFQWLIWSILFSVLSFWLSPLFVKMAETSSQLPTMQATQESQEFAMMIAKVFEGIEFSWVLYFVFFVITGYLLYGLLFAAVGSLVERASEAGKFSFPIMLPIIAAIILLSGVLFAPESTLSRVLGWFPLTAPVIMVARIPVANLPWWDIALSMLLMLITLIITARLAEKIYRIAILVYGKTPDYKLLLQWLLKS